MPKKQTEEPQVEALVEEPTVEELVDEPTEPEERPIITMTQMSLALSNQTFAIIGSLGQGLKTRYDQVVAMEFDNLPPKVRKEKEGWKKGYIRALNDIAEGLVQYQNEITERAIADGTLTRDEVPDLPEPEAAAQETVEGLE